MSMERPGLAQSADKQVLFARLGLNEHIHRILLVGFLQILFRSSSANITDTYSRKPSAPGTV
jgi:hypothetical protein